MSGLSSTQGTSDAEGTQRTEELRDFPSERPSDGPLGGGALNQDAPQVDPDDAEGDRNADQVLAADRGLTGDIDLTGSGTSVDTSPPSSSDDTGSMRRGDGAAASGTGSLAAAASAGPIVDEADQSGTVSEPAVMHDASAADDDALDADPGLATGQPAVPGRPEGADNGTLDTPDTDDLGPRRDAEL